ncbi:MAG TPA: undecaprenyl diphosphate synthase family protein [Methanocorpusculum sp.]|nr:undecaprenyl diphosphate synthase family protein [Methanocorpusculum sp.]
MRHPFYEKKIASELCVFPKELCIMLTGAEAERSPEKIAEVVSWTAAFPQIERLIFHISTSCPESILIPVENLKGTVRFVSEKKDTVSGSGTPEIIIAVGKSGRQEICDAIVSLAEEKVSPEDISEKTIEDKLKFQVSPDYVIKTGGSHLTDFLIWQSVYSELFFTDVNWNHFRRVDFLRALRDFQTRVRRFGK